jgi:S-DNA-T family DNA segregation ATPase FtsK/SpoIIIE
MGGFSRSGVTYEVPDFRKLLRRGDEKRIKDEILLEKARVIEDTLMSFGAPGKVVEVNPGPVITQFGVEPDYVMGRSGRKMRVKVGAIARLDADLALALAARSIRIEAPVPGKGFVGIEVPNDEVALVGLYDIMESPEFTRIDSKLRIALGLAVDGTPVAADLTAMPHLLIAGTTGSGKSVCVNSIISCLLLQNTPEDVQFIMVDPKRVELTGYNGIPHLVAPVVVDLERIVGVLQWVQREMEERYRKFAAIAARNILDYNHKIGPDETKMPYYIVVVDELADLMMLAPDETERLLTRLAQMSRATGIHLIISTQRPSVDIITGLIKANFPARIAFAVASSVDSRVILDQPGAEKLLGRGDMLYQSPDAAAPLRMQGVFVSDEEIIRITRYWKGLLLQEADEKGDRDALASPSRDLAFKPLDTSAPRPKSRPAQRPLWDNEDVDEEDESGLGEDELYDQAVELIQRLNKASISLLQRRLRIGYTRAARLIDRMEAEGIVGPAESGSKPREVIKSAPRQSSGDD